MGVPSEEGSGKVRRGVAKEMHKRRGSGRGGTHGEWENTGK